MKKLIKNFVKYINNESGISLIEVVVATAISSIILIIIYSAHSSITTSIQKLTGIADFFENLNLAISRIDKDISCAYFSRDNKKICFIGESSYEPPYHGKLNFVTVDNKDFFMLSNVKSPYPKSDIKEIGYFLKRDEGTNDLFYLVRREENHYNDEPEEGGENNIILENVVDINFEFRKGNDWTKTWDSREVQKFPSEIKTTLKVKNYGGAEEEFSFISRINLKK